MKTLLLALFFIPCQLLKSQNKISDSSIIEFSRLTCECATLLHIDQGDSKAAIRNLGTCINSTISLYESNGWIKKEWLTDSVWSRKFDDLVQDRLAISCPAFKSLLDKINPKAPDPLPAVNDKYFLSKASMIKKGMEFNASAANPNMHRWSAKDIGHSPVQIVFDIRYVFRNEKEASDYFKAKWVELSEGGSPTIKSLKVFGAAESKVFGANPGIMGAFGDLDMAQYNFVFRVKNVVAKVFVSTSKKATYEQALAFAKEAISRIRAVK